MPAKRTKQTHPALFESGFLEINIADLEKVFLGINETPRRKMLTSQLRIFIHKLLALGVKGEIWIDGSFSTRNPEPMDYDVLLVIPRVVFSGMMEKDKQELNDLSDNRELTLRKWSCDLYVIDSNNLGDRRYYEDLFSRNPDGANRKGIPVIKL